MCDAGQIGDGRRCYGNLMERLIELDRSGNQRENLTGAVALFGKRTTNVSCTILYFTVTAVCLILQVSDMSPDHLLFIFLVRAKTEY